MSRPGATRFAALAGILTLWAGSVAAEPASTGEPPQEPADTESVQVAPQEGSPGADPAPGPAPEPTQAQPLEQAPQTSAAEVAPAAATKGADTTPDAASPLAATTPAAEDNPSPPPEVAEEAAPAKVASVRVEPFAGLGGGTRSFRRPTKEGAQRLPDAGFVAAEVGLRVGIWPQDAFGLDVLLRYQTSLGLTVTEPDRFSLPNQVSVRAERVELSVAPRLRLGEQPDDPAIALPIGFGVRTFWPEFRELTTPAYSLAGPLARLLLIATVVDGVSLQVGPEVHFITGIDRKVRVDGVESNGLALGVEAQLQFRINAQLALELTYRQSHASAPGRRSSGPDFEDVERYATARIAGTL